MSETHEGGCLCGALRYAVACDPMRLTWCTCHFCQRMTGAPMNALAGFSEEAFAVTKGEVRVYTHVSEGSGKDMHLHSCPVCATTAYVTLERFPGSVGVMAGTLDDPNWFERTPENAKYIFMSGAQKGTLVQAGFPVFEAHATTLDGTPIAPVIHGEHCLVHA